MTTLALGRFLKPEGDEFYCPCSKGTVIEEHGNIPDVHEHVARLVCDCCKGVSGISPRALPSVIGGRSRILPGFDESKSGEGPAADVEMTSKESAACLSGRRSNGFEPPN